MAASRGNEFIMRSCHTYFPCLPLPSPSVRPSGRLQSTLSIPRAHHRTMQSEKEDGLPAMRSSASREFDRIRGNADVRARYTRARGCKRRWNTVTVERIHRVALRRERKRRTGEEEREMKRMNNGKSGARGRERERDRGTWSRSRGIRRSCATARGSSSPGTPLYRQVQSRRESAIVPKASSPYFLDQESVETRDFCLLVTRKIRYDVNVFGENKRKIDRVPDSITIRWSTGYFTLFLYIEKVSSLDKYLFGTCILYIANTTIKINIISKRKRIK